MAIKKAAKPHTGRRPSVMKIRQLLHSLMAERTLNSLISPAETLSR
jgi:hypothetical protein